METQYGAGGVVTRQQDEMGRTTRFEKHDLGGNPETVILPSDDDDATDPGERRYEYRYDERGDVEKVVDPRGDGTTEDGDPEETGENDPYVTTLEYDAFGRLIRERIPRLSRGGDAFPFVERKREFDRDGNAVRMWDEREKLTEIDYDLMGQPVEFRAPGSRAPETADDDPEAIKYPPDVTRFVYDDAQRMISVTRPNGASASGAPGFANTVRGEHLAACEQGGAQGEHPFSTRYCLDHQGRPLGEVEYSTRPGDIARRIVTFRYDGRGNLTRLADPNRNTDPEAHPNTPLDQTPLTIAAAIAPETVAARYRFATTYDALDRPLTQEDRGRVGDDAPSLTRTYSYTDDADLELDRIVDKHGADDRIVKLGHDDMGRLKFRTDYPEGDGEGRFGRTTCFKRQHDGLVTAIATPRAGTTQARCLADHDFQHSTTEYTYNAVGDVLSRTIPRAAGQYGPEPESGGEWVIRYHRDAVGNAEKIFDAKGNPAIVNTFFDGGQLRSTTRPSFFELQWPGSANNPSSGRRFGGTDAADVEVAQGGPAVAERGDRSANAEKSEQRPATPPTLGRGDLGDVTPEPLPSWLPQAGATTFHYDQAMQLTEVEDAAGEGRKISYDHARRIETKSWPMVAQTPGTQQEEILHEFRYDDDGNLTSVKEDWEERLYVDTSFEYDGYGRRITEIAEGAQDSPTDTVTPEVTRFRYDANDNVRFRVTPRPVTPQSTERLTFEFQYDSRDNLRSEVNPAGERWQYQYNPFGEPTREIAPHAAADAESLFTTGARVRPRRTAHEAHPARRRSAGAGSRADLELRARRGRQPAADDRSRRARSRHHEGRARWPRPAVANDRDRRADRRQATRHDRRARRERQPPAAGQAARHRSLRRRQPREADGHRRRQRRRREPRGGQRERDRVPLRQQRPARRGAPAVAR
jgi:YD repeat-containing protein